ncbi:MAG: MarR family transcriptional regulator [Cytophagales bacterium]|nr:MarR family transcriptional regulator [Bernardetiaceae bacterium]MDW8204930.1 MarR family transcriptional regulator [Cytophagales bacterium]
MRIEEELQQSRFDSEHHKAALNILFTAGWINAIDLSILKPFGISPQQFNVLRILRGQHPSAVRLCDITPRMLDRMSNTARLVEKLRLKGLVSREQNPQNRRAVNISITDKGLALLKAIDAKMPEWYSHFQNISSEEATQLNVLLDKLRGN